MARLLVYCNTCGDWHPPPDCAKKNPGPKPDSKPQPNDPRSVFEVFHSRGEDFRVKVAEVYNPGSRRVEDQMRSVEQPGEVTMALVEQMGRIGFSSADSACCIYRGMRVVARPRIVVEDHCAQKYEITMSTEGGELHARCFLLAGDVHHRSAKDAGTLARLLLDKFESMYRDLKLLSIRAESERRKRDNEPDIPF